MAKLSGGTRKYSSETATNRNRLAYYNRAKQRVSTDDARSSFNHKSGGYVLVDKEHNEIVNRRENKEDRAALILAARGYRIELQSEHKAQGIKSYDGTINGKPMDIKTVNKSGKYTVRNSLIKAIEQGVRNVVFYQNNKKVDKKYIISKLESFKRQSPNYASKIDKVYVVGLSGRVHIHKMN